MSFESVKEKLESVLVEDDNASMSELEMGIEVEQEHRESLGEVLLLANPDLDDDDLEDLLDRTAEAIVNDHLDKIEDYYTRLAQMESDAEGDASEAADDVDESAKNLRDKILAFFRQNPNPDDSKVHEFAKRAGVDPHELETNIYGILSDLIKRVDRGTEGL